MKECIKCGWRGRVKNENMPEEREDYAEHCPACGHQTLEKVEERVRSLINHLKGRGIIHD